MISYQAVEADPGRVLVKVDAQEYSEDVDTLHFSITQSVSGEKESTDKRKKRVHGARLFLTG